MPSRYLSAGTASLHPVSLISLCSGRISLFAGRRLYRGRLHREQQTKDTGLRVLGTFVIGLASGNCVLLRPFAPYLESVGYLESRRRGAESHPHRLRVCRWAATGILSAAVSSSRSTEKVRAFCAYFRFALRRLPPALRPLALYNPCPFASVRCGIALKIRRDLPLVWVRPHLQHH